MALNLRKWLEEATAQANPFDKGKTAATVRAARNQAPPAQTRSGGLSVGVAQPGRIASVAPAQPAPRVQVAQPQPVQMPKVTLAPTQNLRVGNQVIKNTTSVNPNAPAPKPVDPLWKPNPVLKTAATAGLGITRSAVGQAQGLSGLLDLVSPGTGTNRFSKTLDRAAVGLDDFQQQNDMNRNLYRAGQLGGEIAGFKGASAATSKLINNAPAAVQRGVTTVDDLAAQVAGRVPIANAGGRIAQAALREGFRPANVAADLASTSRFIGEDASKGYDITPQRVALDVASSAALNFGLPAAGQALREGAGSIRPTTRLVGQTAVRTAQGLSGAVQRADQAMFTPRANLNDQAVLRDYSDYLAGANPARGSELSDLMAQARQVGEKHGIDLATGSRVDHLDRTNSILDQIGQQNRSVAQGGYLGTEPKPQTRKGGFTQSVKAAREVSDETKAIVNSDYTVRNTKQLADEAEKFAASKGAVDKVNESLAVPLGKLGDQDVARAIATAKKLDGKGDFNAASAIYDGLDEHLRAAGQAVQAASLLSRRTPDGLKFQAQRDLKKALGKSADKAHLAKIDELTNAIRKTKPDTAERGLAVYNLSKYVSDQIPVGTANKIVNFWRAGLLTAPTTTGGNILGNTGEALVRKGFVNPVAAGVDKLISLKTGKRTVTNAGGFAQGAAEGRKKLGTFIKTGYDERNALQKYDAANAGVKGVNEINYGNDGLGKLIGQYVNGTYRLMSVADQPFWYGARNEALTNIAKAEAINNGLRGQARKDFIKDFVSNPPEKALARATEEAKYATFQNETTLGNVASGIKRSSGKARPVADFIIPFTQVPASIATRIVQRTPVGAAIEAVKQMRAIKAGGEFDQRAMSQAIAEGAFGPAAVGAGYALYNSGLMTFGYPEDNKERKLWEAEGKQPYSVRIGDRWYSLNYLQPFGTLLSVGGEAAQSVKDGEDATSAVSRGIARAGQAVQSQSFLQGVSGVLEAIDDPQRYAKNLTTNTASSVVPNFVRSFARSSDSVQREQQGAVEGIKGAIPGLRQTLPEKTDIFGEPLAPKDNFANQYLNPLRPSKAKEGDATTKELRRLQDVDEGVLPSKATQTTFGKERKLDRSQVKELNDVSGKAIKYEYDRLISSPEFQALSDEDRAKALKKVNSTVYGAIRNIYGQEFGYTKNEDLTRDQMAYLAGEAVEYITRPKQTAAATSKSAASKGAGRRTSSSRRSSGGRLGRGSRSVFKLSDLLANDIAINKNLRNLLKEARL